MEKNKFILFFIKYAGYTPDQAEDFYNEFPLLAEESALKIRKSILNDKSCSDSLKQEIEKYFV